MVQKWLNSGYEKPAGGTGFESAGSKWGDGLDTAVTQRGPARNPVRRLILPR